MTSLCCLTTLLAQQAIYQGKFQFSSQLPKDSSLVVRTKSSHAPFGGLCDYSSLLCIPPSPSSTSHRTGQIAQKGSNHDGHFGLPGYVVKSPQRPRELREATDFSSTCEDYGLLSCHKSLRLISPWCPSLFQAWDKEKLVKVCVPPPQGNISFQLPVALTLPLPFCVQSNLCKSE